MQAPQESCWPPESWAHVAVRWQSLLVVGRPDDQRQKLIAKVMCSAKAIQSTHTAAVTKGANTVVVREQSQTTSAAAAQLQSARAACGARGAARSARAARIAGS